MEFKPYKVNVTAAAPTSQGERLHEILAHCKEGDVLVCVTSHVHYYTEGRVYQVITDPKEETLVILDNDRDYQCSSVRVLFIKKDVQVKEEHDTWGIGKQYKAPKKEWQPDVMDVDLTKKIWEW